MAGANCIASHVAQNLKPPLPHALGHGRAYAAGFLVKAYAVELDVFPVEQESLVCVKDSFPNADGRVVHIHRAPGLTHRGANRIKIRMGRRPEAGVGEIDALNKLIIRARLDGLRRFTALDGNAVLVENCGGQYALGVGLAAVRDPGLDLDGGRLR